MKFEMNVGKKHLYIAAFLIAIMAFVVFAAANSRNPGHSYQQIDLALKPITIDQANNVVTIDGDLTVNGNIGGKLIGLEDTSSLNGGGNGDENTISGKCVKKVSNGDSGSWTTCNTGYYVAAVGAKAEVGNNAAYIIYLCCPLPGY